MIDTLGNLVALVYTTKTNRSKGDLQHYLKSSQSFSLVQKTKL